MRALSGPAQGLTRVQDRELRQSQSWLSRMEGGHSPSKTLPEVSTANVSQCPGGGIAVSVTLNGRGLGPCLGSGVVTEGFPKEDILVFNPE